MVLFEDGKPKKHYNQYFLPTNKITAEASKVNGLTQEKLLKLGALPWTKGRSNMLATFLNEHRDLPIVVFSMKYDRDEVLGAAFDRVKNRSNFPESRRWICTYKLSFRMQKLKSRHLDDILEAIGLDRRK